MIKYRNELKSVPELNVKILLMYNVQMYKPTDIPTSFAVDTAHEAKSPPLNKFTPLPPIFVNSRSAQVKKKELNLPNLHHQE